MQGKEKIGDEHQKNTDEYFIVLLKKDDLLFTSWKIADPEWIENIEKEESDSEQREYMHIDAFSVENGKYDMIESIPVYGLENSWHIFMKNGYFGRRILLKLSFNDRNGKTYDILKSREIDIPVSIKNLQDEFSHNENLLYELSGINFTGLSGSENTSW